MLPDKTSNSELSSRKLMGHVSDKTEGISRHDPGAKALPLLNELIYVTHNSASNIVRAQ